MGRSLYDQELFPRVLEVLGHLVRRAVEIICGGFQDREFPQVEGNRKECSAQEIPPETMALDVGPATSILFDEAIKSAETIIWNGPLGSLRE